jgi:hypothetical protein
MLRKVENKNRYRTAQPYYYHLHEFDDHGSPVDYLFTINQLDNAEERARANPEDIVEDGILENRFVAGLCLGLVLGSAIGNLVYFLCVKFDVKSLLGW